LRMGVTAHIRRLLSAWLVFQRNFRMRMAYWFRHPALSFLFHQATMRFSAGPDRQTEFIKIRCLCRS
jgi:hypothetical protein